MTLSEISISNYSYIT